MAMATAKEERDDDDDDRGGAGQRGSWPWL
jgi:hypothetical protein